MDKRTSGWRAVLAALWVRAQPALAALGGLVSTYLDDLLMVAAGVCFVRGAGYLGGQPAAQLTAGVCLLAYAIVIARARKAGGRR